MKTLATAVLLVGVAGGFSSAPVSASVITTYDRAGFTSTFGGDATVQTFDGFVAGTLLGTVDGVTYSTAIGSPIVTGNYVPTTGAMSLGSTSSGDFFAAFDSAIFQFASAITAFAIDINTFATRPNSYSALTSAGDVVASVFAPFPGASTGQFIGFSSDTPFTSVTLSANREFSYTLDTLRYVTARSAVSVSEPATLALLGIGLVGVVVVRRRRALRN